MSLAEYREENASRHTRSLRQPDTVIQRSTGGRSAYAVAMASLLVTGLYNWPEQGVPYTLIEPSQNIEDYVASKSVGWTAIADEIIYELGRLPRDWAGSGTMVPSNATITDVECVIGYFPAQTRRPAVEVDAETGHVSLSWFSSDNRQMFSLLFTGNNHEVIGSYSSLNPGEAARPWKYKVEEEAKIVRRVGF